MNTRLRHTWNGSGKMYVMIEVIFYDLMLYFIYRSSGTWLQAQKPPFPQNVYMYLQNTDMYGWANEQWKPTGITATQSRLNSSWNPSGSSSVSFFPGLLSHTCNHARSTTENPIRGSLHKRFTARYGRLQWHFADRKSPFTVIQPY